MKPQRFWGEGWETMKCKDPSLPHSPTQTYNTIKDSHASKSTQQSPKYHISSIRTYLKPSEMNNLFTMKAYICTIWNMMGKGKNKNNWKKNKEKTRLVTLPSPVDDVESRIFSGNLSGLKTSWTIPMWGVDLN